LALVCLFPRDAGLKGRIDLGDPTVPESNLSVVWKITPAFACLPALHTIEFGTLSNAPCASFSVRAPVSCVIFLQHFILTTAVCPSCVIELKVSTSSSDLDADEMQQRQRRGRLGILIQSQDFPFAKVLLGRPLAECQGTNQRQPIGLR
jgi:hypothetical protein